MATVEFCPVYPKSPVKAFPSLGYRAHRIEKASESQESKDRDCWRATSVPLGPRLQTHPFPSVTSQSMGSTTSWYSRLGVSARNPGEWLFPDGALAVAKMSYTVFFSFVLFLGSQWGVEAHSISVTEGTITSILSWQLEGWKTHRGPQPGWLAGPSC